MAFPIRGQDWTMLPSAKWGVLCCLAPSQNLALYTTFLETPKSGCESVVWEHWDTGQEDWIACLRGCLGAASVIPVAFSTWGDPPRSRSPPCLQAAQIKSAADNLFFFFSHLHSSTCFLCFPGDPEVISSVPNRGHVYFPLYMWNSLAVACI